VSKTFSLWDRLLGGVVVIAANAGGAWTPIGDVTTTMLWIHGQITTLKIIQVNFTQLFLCYVRGLYIYFLALVPSAIVHYFINSHGTFPIS
jgi:Na+/H+ antiporter NhaD/arsenite permease-like protein